MNKYFSKYFYFDNENKSKAIEVELYYNIGGMNYFQAKTEVRGLYAAISPLTVDPARKYKVYGAFTGIKTLIKELPRKSDKEGNRLAAILAEIAEEVARDFYENNKNLAFDKIKNYLK